MIDGADLPGFFIWLFIVLLVCVGCFLVLEGVDIELIQIEICMSLMLLRS